MYQSEIKRFEFELELFEVQAEIRTSSLIINNDGGQMLNDSLWAQIWKTYELQR